MNINFDVVNQVPTCVGCDIWQGTVISTWTWQVARTVAIAAALQVTNHWPKTSFAYTKTTQATNADPLPKKQQVAFC